MATLRAWERRYDFPDSKRTKGGHRLYSEQDILRLQWVKDRIEEGMQTAQSIKALRHQEQYGNLIFSGETSSDQMLELEQKDTRRGESIVEQYVEQLVELLVDHNSTAADQVITNALAVFSPEEVILDIITPSLKQFGDLWEDGSINIADEHWATNYLRRKLLSWMISGPPSMKMNPIILACAPDEWHEGSLLAMGALLRRRRYPVAYLGQAVPLADLAKFVNELDPVMVVIVAMTENSATNLISSMNWLPEAAHNGKPIIGYSGRIFIEKPDWRRRMKGVFLGSSLREGVQTIERLLQI